MLNHTWTCTRIPGRGSSPPPTTHSPSWTNTAVLHIDTNDHTRWTWVFMPASFPLTQEICRCTLSNSDIQAESLTSIWKEEWLNSHFPFCCKTIYRDQTSSRPLPDIYIKQVQQFGVRFFLRSGPDPVTLNTDKTLTTLMCSSPAASRALQAQISACNHVISGLRT